MCAALRFAEALLHCPKSDRIPWIPDGGIDVTLDPWSSYTSPNDKCCDVTDPDTAFDPDGMHTFTHMHGFALIL